jgi:hypothetical protein
VRIDGDAGAGLLLVEVALRQLAIVGHRADVEQHFALRFIGMAALRSALNQRHHLRVAVGPRAELGRPGLD